MRPKTPATDPPGTHSRRFLAYATLLTVVVAAFAGYAADAVLFAPLSLGHRYASLPRSDLATLLTTQVVRALFWVVVALYLAVPVAVTTSLTDRGDRHWLYAAVWSAAAIVALPLALGVAALLSPTPYRPVLALGVVVAAAVPLSAGHLLAVRLGPDHAGTRPPLATFLNVALVGLVAAGAVAGAGVAGPLAGPVLQDRLGGPPVVTWDVEYEPTGDGRGLLTVTHDGGGVARADHLVLSGRGFADVAGADQTAAGPWQGETSDGSVVGAAGRVVARGDSVTVGVTDGCVGSVVWRSLPEGDRTATVGLYECGPAVEEDATLRPSRPPGGRR